MAVPFSFNLLGEIDLLNKIVELIRIEYYFFFIFFITLSIYRKLTYTVLMRMLQLKRDYSSEKWWKVSCTSISNINAVLCSHERCDVYSHWHNIKAYTQTILQFTVNRKPPVRENITSQLPNKTLSNLDPTFKLFIMFSGVTP